MKASMGIWLCWKKIRAFENDYTFSKVTTEENLDITIYNVPLKNMFHERASRTDGIESIEQWVTYYVNKDGELTADNLIFRTDNITLTARLTQRSEGMCQLRQEFRSTQAEADSILQLDNITSP